MYQLSIPESRSIIQLAVRPWTKMETALSGGRQDYL